MDLSIMDLEVRMKRVEDNQTYILQQLNYFQQSIGCMMPPSFVPHYQSPFPPPPFTPFSTSSSQSYVQSQPMTQRSVPSPETFPGSLSSTQQTTPSRSAPTASTNKDGPLPLAKMCTNALPSSAIRKDTLLSVEDVLKKYPKLKHESKAGTLACKIAKEAIFGSDVMKRCTPIGNRELPGLPEKELKVLKRTMFTRFPQYWSNKVEFEPVWKRCLEAVQQCCKRPRHGKE